MPEPDLSEVIEPVTGDAVADRVIAFLEAEGAERYGHGAGRSLLGHLLGTYEIARRWGQPSWLQHAALIHSVYGTEAYRQQLMTLSRRRQVSALAGEVAERLAYLFTVTPRRLLVAGTHRWAPGLVAAVSDGVDEAPTRDELDALVLLHMANIAEQARSSDGSPGAWLVDLRDLAEAVFDSNAVSPPLFLARLAELSRSDEAACRAAYRAALAQTEASSRGDRLAMAAALCPVVGEPCVWLAYEARRRGDLAAAREWAQAARRRMLALGAAWDKRLAFDDWITVIDRLDGDTAEINAAAPAAGPRALYGELALSPDRQAAIDTDTIHLAVPGTERFQRYMGMVADAASSGGRLLYPDLDRRPWWEPRTSNLAVALESHFDEIRNELSALAPSRFAPESEPIARAGDWDVVFFYERGRRHEDVCEACPVTARLIEGAGAIRGPAGLIYVSRMRPGTHIQAHRGPTNLRLRCHLGIVVPDGDCAIRVGDESRGWSEGRCLLFDDSFEHEAWNRTSADRIVLIVDLWHPGLSSLEVHLLEGLHRYASGYGRRLDRYWAVNAATRSDGATT